MIEKIIYDYLKSEGINAFTDIPYPMPEGEFVSIEKTGGTYLGCGIHTATIALQSWAESKMKAAELSASVKKAMDEMPNGVDQIITATGDDYDFTDTRTKRYRYQAVYSIKYLEETR